jgi:hypothetical protein
MREFQAANARDYKNRQGSLSAGGTSSAYTITTNESLAGNALLTAQEAMILCTIHKKSQSGATMQVDGKAAKALVNTAGDPVGDGELTAESILAFAYNASKDVYQIMNERATTDAVLAGDSTTFTNSIILGGSTTFTSSIQTTAAKFTSGLNGVQYMNNFALQASVSGNNLTIAIKGKDLTDPSANNVVSVAFRSEDKTDGDYDIVDIEAATSITIDAGETLGFSNDEDGYVYIYLLNNAGTVDPAVAKQALFDESRIHSSTALAASADNDRTLYSTTARSNVPLRLGGRARIIHGTNVWDAAPVELSVWNPQMKKTGDIVQMDTYRESSLLTASGAWANDDTIPSAGESVELFSRAIVPIVPINRMIVEATLHLSTSGGTQVKGGIFKNSAAAALAIGANEAGTNIVENVNILLEDEPVGTATAVYQIRGAPTTSGNIILNGNTSGTRLHGGILASTLKITEIQK